MVCSRLGYSLMTNSPTEFFAILSNKLRSKNNTFVIQRNTVARRICNVRVYKDSSLRCQWQEKEFGLRRKILKLQMGVQRTSINHHTKQMSKRYYLKYLSGSILSFTMSISPFVKTIFCGDHKKLRSSAEMVSNAFDLSWL